MQDEPLLSLCNSTFFPLNIRIRSEDTRYQYRIAFRSYGRFLGRVPTVADLQNDPITAWMTKRLDEGTSAVTVREQAGRLQTLWTWLAKRGMLPTFPQFIKPDCPESMPYALTPAQLSALFASASKERGTIGPVPADLWWLSFFAFVWNTSERKTATMLVRPQWLTLDDAANAKATVPSTVRKGRKKGRVYDIWPETVPLLRACIAVAPDREHVWPFPYCKASFYTRYNRILRGAGIPVNRKTKTHALRVSHATYRDAAGGDATKQLGHADRATTLKSYIDPRQSPPDNVKLFIPWQQLASCWPPPSGPSLPPAA